MSEPDPKNTAAPVIVSTVENGATSDNAALSDKEVDQYRIYCCREGAVAVPAHITLETKSDQSFSICDSDETVLLPRCRVEDELLPQPPLALTLSGSDIKYLKAVDGHPAATAATCFGPKQDKSQNEDFALAALFPGTTSSVAFAAVADGVTEKTFWPERAARLACFVAYQTVRDLISKWEDSSESISQALQTSLAERLRESFICDHRLLISSATRPLDWKPNLFDKYKDVLDFWYNSTLLVGIINSEKVLTCAAGDGGIMLEHKENHSSPLTKTILLESTDNLKVDEWVSLTRNTRFDIHRIELETATPNAMTLHLVTDGVDRSLQRQRPLGGLASLKLENGSKGVAELKEIWEQEGADRDNYSGARLSSVGLGSSVGFGTRLVHVLGRLRRGVASPERPKEYPPLLPGET